MPRGFGRGGWWWGFGYPFWGGWWNPFRCFWFPWLPRWWWATPYAAAYAATIPYYLGYPYYGMGYVPPTSVSYPGPTGTPPSTK